MLAPQLNMYLGVLATIFGFVVGDSHKPPAVYMTAPVIALKPGTLVSARLESPGGKRCEGTLTFSNTDFLPLRFVLPWAKCPDPGSQLAEFTVPQEVPNGEAHILWRYADSPTSMCTRAMISDGKSDANRINYSQNGINKCVFATETRTAFITSVGPGSITTVIPSASTLFSTGTPSDAIPTPTATVSLESISTGVTAIVKTITDGTSVLTQTIISPLFSATIVQNDQQPTLSTTPTGAAAMHTCLSSPSPSPTPQT